MMILAVLTLIVQADNLVWPINGDITSGYGPRWGKIHEGIDISALEGTWVRSVASGMVVFTGHYGKYGNMVTVKHYDGTKTFYAHLKDYCVFKRQRVKKGQKIGKVGTTGKTTGPHLHFEIHVNREAQDPLSLLPPRKLGEPSTRPRAVGGP